MHNTKDGTRKNLFIRIYKDDPINYQYTYYETTKQFDEFVNKEIQAGRAKIKNSLGFSDEGMMFNEMIKTKNTPQGDILWEIYDANYGPSDMRTKIEVALGKIKSE